MKFSKVKNISIPEGLTAKIKFGGITLWDHIRFRYVSLGDSIAAGHSIHENWESQYGVGSQYGENGRTQTVIVPNSYTDLIRQELVNIYGAEHTETKSFAHSGDQTQDLTNKLNDTPIKDAIAKADAVTVCIGANNILVPAMEKHFAEYVQTGDLSGLEATINSQLAILSAGRNSQNVYPYSSYGLLLDTLYALNKRATYVFSTIYHPFKYLYLDEGLEGFFAPLLNLIPDFNLGIPNTPIQVNVGELIRQGLLNTPSIQLLYNRTNQLGGWLEPRIENLNSVIRNAVAEYNAYRGGESNFKIAETKQLFDTYPDRPVSASVHYNDLVNVEYTRGYDTAQMAWPALWSDSNALAYWTNLATKHMHFTNTAPFYNFDIGSFSADLVEDIITKVIAPDVDPHPEEYGHIVLKSAFNQVMQLQ
jgi:hypothetical protein